MPTTDQAQAAIAKATSDPHPEIEPSPDSIVDLPAGWLVPDGVVQTARVRELTGYDEEQLARIPRAKNVPAYVTEMLALGVEDLGGQKPTKDMIRAMLIGDREALLLGIRRVTYGNEVQFKLNCESCGTESDVDVLLDSDVEIRKLDDPKVREWDVPLKHGTARIQLMTGLMQEALGESLGKKTAPKVTRSCWPNLLSPSMVFPPKETWKGFEH
jgi:hypothetical protein